MTKGWKTHLIGTSPAPGCIESLVSKLKPNIVLLSATTTIPFETDAELLKRLDRFAEKQKDIVFYLGGEGAINYKSEYKLKFIHITNSIDDILKE